MVCADQAIRQSRRTEPDPPYPMKDSLASLIRHATTALLALGGLLASRGFIDPSDVAAVDAAGVSLQGALVVIVVAIVGRLCITLTGKIFPAVAAKLTGTEAGGLPSLAWIGTLAGLLCTGLPACSPAQIAAARAIPVKACVITPQGKICYSDVEGLSAEIDASGK